MSASYGWRITRDVINIGEPRNEVGLMGPCDMLPEPATWDDESCAFRMYDDELYFEGYLWGRFYCTEPLDDFGRSYGCTRIDVNLHGKWETV